MVKHGALQERIIKLISQFFPYQKSTLQNTAIEFSIIVSPFNTDLCKIAIEKFKDIDSIKVTCIIFASPKIQQSLKKLSEEEMELTMTEFDKIYHKQFKTEYKFSKDYTSIQNMRFFLTQNLSYQSLLDLIFLYVILAREVAKIFKDMDEGIKYPEIDPNNSMYK